MIEEIVYSAPARGPSDDAFGFAQAGGALHAWVIDGATSVSEVPDKVVPGLSDAAWFARALSVGIARAVRRHPLTDGALVRILDDLSERFARKAGPVAPHDVPVAAMTYLHLTPVLGGARLRVLDHADCFAAPLPPRLRAGPRHLSHAPPRPFAEAALTKSGPLIARLRARRAAQVSEGAGTALTLRPDSVTSGRRWTRHLPARARVLIGSDGLARLWTEYALASRDEVLAEIGRGGLLGQLVRLRDWERTHFAHGAAPKPADDATALVLALDPDSAADPRRRRGHLRRHAGSLHWFAASTGRHSAGTVVSHDPRLGLRRARSVPPANDR